MRIFHHHHYIANRTEFDFAHIAQNTFEYVNKLKLTPIKIIKEMESIYSDLTFEFNNPDENKIKIQNSNSNCSELIKDNTSENEMNDETAFSIKDIRYKELKSKINELSNEKKLNFNAILRSEKLSSIISELLTGSYKTRSPDAVLNFLQDKFENKFSFSEINWIGDEEGLTSLTKFAFNSLYNVENLLKTSYNFGAVHVNKNLLNQLEFSLILATANKINNK